MKPVGYYGASEAVCKVIDCNDKMSKPSISESELKELCKVFKTKYPMLNNKATPKRDKVAIVRWIVAEASY